MSVNKGDGEEGFAKINAVLIARVAWKTALARVLISMLGVDVRGGADGV